jgi:hypothetical protein
VFDGVDILYQYQKDNENQYVNNGTKGEYDFVVLINKIDGIEYIVFHVAVPPVIRLQLNQEWFQAYGSKVEGASP